MSDLIPFLFKDATLRVSARNNGPWFVLVDACKLLDINNPAQAAARLDSDEKDTIILNDGIRGNPNTIIINESGLYSLVLGSRKPEAKTFKRWVTHEVLPALRRTGSYGSTPQPIDLTDSNFVLKLLEAQATKALAETKRADDAETRVAVLAPRAAALDEIAASSGSASISEAAKILNVRQGRLFSYLEENVWIFRRRDADGNPGRWLARAEMLEKGWLEHAATSYFNRRGDRVMERQVRVTAAGIARLSYIFNKFGHP
jgi:prophage antirepressor-like protein